MTPKPRRAKASPFGGPPGLSRPEDAAATILPIPFEQTTSYGKGTRLGPAALLAASSQVELWDEEIGVDVHSRGLCTLPHLVLPRMPMARAMAEIERAAADAMARAAWLVSLGGEHSITSALVAAAAARYPDLSVLQIDAHADLRDAWTNERHSHACAMRRTLDHGVTLVQVGIRNISEEEVKALDAERLKTRIFYDWNMRDDPQWIDRAIDALSPHVYLTIDLDGLEPGLMPSVGTPEPGGLAWRELTTILRRLFERREVVAADVVELAPRRGLVGPDFIAAKVVYKLLTYKLGRRASFPQ
jgi:agmatinase